jgi:hypothetical protein
MTGTALLKEIDFKEYLLGFNLDQQIGLFDDYENGTEIETTEIDGKRYSKFINEYWTSKQRQASALHEISYRACFKAQLPRFFINLFTNEGDTVYDPFGGRGTTAVESALMGRNVISNDINPLSKILSAPRLAIPSIYEIKERLNEIHIDRKEKADIDLSMFYNHDTEAEIVSLRNYLKNRQEENEEDYIDSWIRMVATNRLTGHSNGFFSVYTLPPNQAVLPENQRKINEKRNKGIDYQEIESIN